MQIKKLEIMHEGGKTSIKVNDQLIERLLEFNFKRTSHTAELDLKLDLPVVLDSRSDEFEETIITTVCDEANSSF